MYQKQKDVNTHLLTAAMTGFWLVDLLQKRKPDFGKFFSKRGLVLS